MENRFCHTNLSSVRLEWKCGNCRGGCFLPPAGPAKAVKAVICPDNGRLAEDEPIWMAFLDADGIQVDERMLPAERQEGLLPDSAEEQEELYSEPAAGRTNRVNTGIEIQCREQETILKEKGFTMAFRNDTGLLAGLWADTEKEGKKRLLTGGPILNAPYLKLGGMVSAFPFRGGNTGGSRYPPSRRLSGNPGNDLAYRGQAGRQLYHVLYPPAVI